MTNSSLLHRADFWPLPLHAVGLVAPLGLLAIGTALDRTAGGAEIDTYLSLVAAAPGSYLASGFFMVAGMAGLVATAAALIRLTAGLRRFALLRVGAILLGVWGILGVVGVSLGYTAGWVGIDVEGETSAAVVKRVFEGITYSPWGMVGGGGGGAAYLLGILATGVGLILARGVPSWSGILVLVAPVAMFTGGLLGVPAIMVAGFVLAAAGLAGTIPALLRSPALVAAAPTPARTEGALTPR